MMNIEYGAWCAGRAMANMGGRVEMKLGSALALMVKIKLINDATHSSLKTTSPELCSGSLRVQHKHGRP